MKNINEVMIVNNVSLIVRRGRYTNDFFAIVLFHDEAESFIDSINGSDNEWAAFKETIDSLKWLPVGRGATATDALRLLDGRIKQSLDKQVEMLDLMYSSTHVADGFLRSMWVPTKLPSWCGCIEKVVSREDEFKSLLTVG